MSTVLEAIAARQMGAEVLGISLVTNLAAGLAGHGLSHAEVIEAGQASASRMGALLASILPEMLRRGRAFGAPLRQGLGRQATNLCASARTFRPEW